MHDWHNCLFLHTPNYVSKHGIHTKMVVGTVECLFDKVVIDTTVDRFAEHNKTMYTYTLLNRNALPVAPVNRCIGQSKTI